MLKSKMPVIPKIDFPAFVRPKQANIFGLAEDKLLVATKIDETSHKTYIFVNDKKQWYPIDEFFIYPNIKPN